MHVPNTDHKWYIKSMLIEVKILIESLNIFRFPTTPSTLQHKKQQCSHYLFNCAPTLIYTEPLSSRSFSHTGNYMYKEAMRA